MYSWSTTEEVIRMKTDQQRKLVYIVGALTLVAIFASSLVAGKYPQYTDHVSAGLGVFVVLLGALAVFMIRTKET
jgi:hypothetical protein